MATLIGPPTSITVARTQRPILEFKGLWSDAWTQKPEYEFLHATAAAGGQDVGRLEVQRPYGRVKFPYSVTIATRNKESPINWWARLMLDDGTGGTPPTVWIGKFFEEARSIHGQSAGGTTTPSGMQRHVAYEPLMILKRIHVSEAWWEAPDGSETQVLTNWAPGFNARDADGFLVGNRSAEVLPRIGGRYAFGGSSRWNAFQAVGYLLYRFADELVVGGPSWTVSAQPDAQTALESIEESIEVEQGEALDSIVRKLIPLNMGLDFVVRETPTGFELYVYSLVAGAKSFRGVTLPANPQTYRFRASLGQTTSMVNVIRSWAQRYDRIRVIGRRVVVCCTLEADAEEGGSLEAKWQPQFENDYKLGTGNPTDPPEDHDAARENDKFSAVYQAFGAPADWDHQAGHASPRVMEDGTISPSVARTFQNSVRKTLGWLPLREQFEYDGLEPSDRNPTGHQGDFLPPAAWILDEATGRYVPCEERGIGIHAPGHDWGIVLRAKPNHLLALRSFTPWEDTTDIPPVYDWQTLKVTIAFEADERLYLEWSVPEPDPGEGVMVVEDRGAELWYLAPSTVFGLTAAGQPRRSPAEGVVLRNDADRLLLRMAGAMARYYDERARAEILLVGLWPFSTLLGGILESVEESGDLDLINAAITGVEYTGGDRPTTRITTGFGR